MSDTKYTEYEAEPTCQFCGVKRKRIMRDSPTQLVSECPACDRTERHIKTRIWTESLSE